MMQVQSRFSEMRFSRPTRRLRDQLASWASPDRFRRISEEEIAAFDPGRLAALASLVYSTMPEFYDLIPLEHGRVIALISTLLGAPGTDLANLHVLADRETDLAFFAELPAASLAVADQLRSLAILRVLDRPGRTAFLASLDGHRSTVEPPSPDGLYASGMAAARSARGMGLGRLATQRILDVANGRTAQFHVKRDNGMAIALYRKFGFEFVSDAPYTYRAMVRAGPAAGS